MFEAIFEKAFKTLIKKQHISEWGNYITRSHTENMTNLKAYCAGMRLFQVEWDFLNWDELTWALVDYLAELEE